uniref:DnaJ homolog subfamily C member 4 n=1 Tax=Oryctolagus cuniculus TaxID=9986 RepID=G1T965_RABIT
MPPLWSLLPPRLCRRWPRSPPCRLFGAAAAQRSSPRNYYELLGVHPGASAAEVKRAFFAKSKELHPDRDPGNPALHGRFVELSEAYRVLSREQSRRSYDHQLRSASPPKSAGTTAHANPARQTHSSWEPPNAQYWAQFHRVRPQGPGARQQHQHNQRVLGYCLLLMLAGMGLHYAAFRCVPGLPGVGQRAGEAQCGRRPTHPTAPSLVSPNGRLAGTRALGLLLAKSHLCHFPLLHNLNVNPWCWLPRRAGANQNRAQEVNALSPGPSAAVPRNDLDFLQQRHPGASAPFSDRPSCPWLLSPCDTL